MFEPQSCKTVRAVQDYVALHVTEKITVREIAQTLHLHPSYLNTCFCNRTGMSVKTYIHTVKTREACRLLRETTCSLTRIGAMLGYFDQSHFTRVFKKAVGVTPGEYRRAERSEK